MTKLYDRSEEKEEILMQNKTYKLEFMFKKKQEATCRGAFTLVELLVVIMILGILAGLIVKNVVDAGTKAKIDLTCTQMSSVKESLEMFKVDNGRFPDTEEGLEALISNPDADKYPNYSVGGYIKKIPTDPWKTPYQYVNADKEISLVSLSADRAEGGEGFDADIEFPKCSE
jgi:general secretion pathway protein G